MQKAVHFKTLKPNTWGSNAQAYATMPPDSEAQHVGVGCPGICKNALRQHSGAVSGAVSR